MNKYHLLLILLIVSAKYALSAYKANFITDNEVITEILEAEVKRKEEEARRIRYKIGDNMEYGILEELRAEIDLVYSRIREIEKDSLKYQELFLYASENKEKHHLLEGLEVVEEKYIELPEVLKYHFLKVDVFRFLKNKIPDNRHLAEKDRDIIINRVEEKGKDSIILVLAPAYCVSIPDEMQFFYKGKKIKVNSNPFYINGDKKDLKMRENLTSTFTYGCY